jgi:hypothetical protein
MIRIECAREQDVLDAIAARRWPARCDADLREHVASCSICADLVEVVGALTDSHDALWPHVQVPSSANVWWRAQLRARQEAARKASRPITVVQVAASLAALAAIAAAIYVIGPWLPGLTFPRAALPALNVSLPRVTLPDVPASVSEVGMWTWVVIAVVLSWAVIAPLVIYFATSEEER